MSLKIPVVWTQMEQYVTNPSTKTPPLPPAVLVVDDETSIRSYVSRVLEVAGYEVVIAGSGAEALERFKDMRRCDLVMTDLSMPNMNGDELARRLRLDDPDLKVLYLTGYSDRLFAEKQLLWDGEAFLDKPCSPKAVMEAVSLLLTGHLAA
ncbi:MAG: response regulator [Acidobacteria bacterium]|nr:response regulator [Acidobacteriota bacterium]